jgi:hypothetical protein
MATYNAIAAVSLAIRGVLTEAARSTFPDARFEVFQASDFHKPQDGLGMSIFLYRLSANTTCRNIPPRLGPDGKRHRSPLPLDLHFMLAPWAPNADATLRLLGWAMRVMDDTPILPAAFVNALDSADTFRSDETLEIVFDPLSLQDVYYLMTVMEPKLQPMATYVVRRVDIESSVELVDAGPVQTRVFSVGTPVETAVLPGVPA